MLYQDGFLQRLETGLRSALSNWGIPFEADLSLLNISENATYLVRDPGNDRRVVLRVHRPCYHTKAEIHSELDWINALIKDNVVATPRPVPARDGALLCSFVHADGPRHVVAFEYMRGKEPDPGPALVKWFKKLGSVAARLHAHSTTWTKPAGFVRKTWNHDTTVGKSAYWGDWRQALELSKEGEAVLSRAVAQLKTDTDQFGATPDRFGLIHCDMRLPNLLVEDERLGVIDFDDCGISWFAYDFAAAITFLEHEPFVPDLMAAWADGYRKVRKFSSADEIALPIFVMLRRIQVTAWIASHSETPGAQALGATYTTGTVELAEKYLANHR